ncbi:MAG: glycoside hydrolase family 15 protein [Acidobacteriota bacterium]|nr:glycoside hydrolase family 15 protein [Acidobacteriota bacterium]
MSCRIEDYALIGDCETAALVGNDGCIDWLCWPRFDSGACFASLLGTDENGCWKLSPADAVKHTSRRYRDKTLILETDFETETGAVTLIDFMPVRGKHSNLVRLVRGKRGSVSMTMELIIRFDYGRSIPWVTRTKDQSLRAIAGPDMTILRTQAPLRGENMKTVSEFTITEGDTVTFVLSYGRSHGSLPEAIDAEKALEKTEAFWRDWTSGCSYHGHWSKAVERSLIALKALTYAPTGGILAAATTSLPEKPKGPRNWDYRFCWLRDATFTLLALMHAGYYDEAAEWQNWLLRAIAGSPEQVQIMYGVAGERHLPEWEIPWLSGYQGALPVRVGNAASGQLQLDIYGEVADALYQARKGGLPKSDYSVNLQSALLNHLAKIWQEPDEGLWEVRGPRRHFTHSKVMAWVAFDRGIKSIQEFEIEGPLKEWSEIRDRIHEEVCQQAFSHEMGSFVQSYGSTNLDASLLQIPLVGFLPADDPRVLGTIRAIERDLMWNGFVRRYNTGTVDDGLPPGEGVFLACSFWLVDCLVLLGRRVDADELLHKLMALRNDVGLLAEEYDPEAKRLVGNFPQAFSHVALVNAVLNISRQAGPVHQRAKDASPKP